jgi:hypothetical protein
MTLLIAAPPVEQQLALEPAHRAWCDEVRTALAAALQPNSGIWDRWAAVQYLERDFMPRLEREVAGVNLRLTRVPPVDAARVWAPAELLGFLRNYLVELASMAQSGVLFAGGVEKLLRAHECWCREVESLGATG